MTLLKHTLPKVNTPKDTKSKNGLISGLCRAKKSDSTMNDIQKLIKAQLSFEKTIRSQINNEKKKNDCILYYSKFGPNYESGFTKISNSMRMKLAGESPYLTEYCLHILSLLKKGKASTTVSQTQTALQWARATVIKYKKKAVKLGIFEIVFNGVKGIASEFRLCGQFGSRGEPSSSSIFDNYDNALNNEKDFFKLFLPKETTIRDQFVRNMLNTKGKRFKYAYDLIERITRKIDSYKTLLEFDKLIINNLKMQLHGIQSLKTINIHIKAHEIVAAIKRIYGPPNV